MPHASQDKRAEMEQLARAISHHDRLYYQQDAPEISDADYDVMRRRLEALEAEFPEFISPESPTQRVGAAPLESFAKVRHSTPMLSLSNAFDAEEVREFDKRIRRFLGLNTEEKVEYVPEPKIDGLSFSARFERGIFVQGATRGDGTTGEDITANLREVTDFPVRLTASAPELFEVRGEVYMTQSNFTALNTRRAQAGEPPFANPRNAAAGSLRQLDSSITRARGLHCFVYSWGEVSADLGPSHRAFRDRLSEWGFPVFTGVLAPATCEIEQALQWYGHMRALRTTLPFALSGYYRQALRHGFEQHDAEWLMLRGQAE